MSTLLSLRDAVADRLEALSALSGVRVVRRAPRQALSDIEAQIAGLALCAVVLPAAPRRFNANLPGPVIEEVEIRVRCLEHPRLNQHSMDVYALAEVVTCALHLWRAPAPWGALLSVDPAGWESADDDTLVGWDVVCLMSASLPMAGEVGG